MPKQTTTDFHEETGKRAASIFGRIREHIMRKHGKDEADEVVPREELQRLEEEARREGEDLRREREEHAAVEGQTGYAEVTALTKKEEDLKRREAEFAEKQRAFAAKERAARRDGFAAFCDGLVKEGRMLPVNKAAAVAVLDYAASAEGTASIEFGEGSDKKSVAPVEAFMLVLASQPKVVTYGEAVHAGAAIPDGEDAMREAKIAEFMEQHKGASYRDAMIEVSREFPNLFGLKAKQK